jgi:NADH dehydrogenase/NADH:ubiquinone oxidoreductase subunit G
LAFHDHLRFEKVVSMITLKINGKTCKAHKGEMLLKIARRNGIAIPTLCHHEAVEPSGSCRLCLVEISKKSWNGGTKLVTSCLYPAEEGLIVQTDSDTVRKMRRTLLDLLIARCPNSEVLQQLAMEYELDTPTYPARLEAAANGLDNCMLCGLCVKICEAIGTSAIYTVNRGVAKIIDTPFHKVSATCMGCLACAENCPTRAIPFKESNGIREIWGKSFAMLRCQECRTYTIPEDQKDFFTKKTGLKPDAFTLCDACKAKKTSQTFFHVLG